MTDSSSHHCRIIYECLYETVSGTSEGLIFIRFFHTSYRICPAVDHNTCPVSINEHTRFTRQQAFQYLIKIKQHFNLNVWNACVGKLPHILWHLFFLHLQKCIHDLQHRLFARKTIYKIKRRNPSSDQQISLNEVKAFLDWKCFIHICYIFFSCLKNRDFLARHVLLTSYIHRLYFPVCPGS